MTAGSIASRTSAMTRIAIVTTTSGRRFWFGAPVDGRVVRDPEFAEKLLQISDYWHMAILGRVSYGEAAGATRLGTTTSPDRDDHQFDIPWKPPPEWP
jgi:hypothetical protein